MNKNTKFIELPKANFISEVSKVSDPLCLANLNEKSTILSINSLEISIIVFFFVFMIKFS